MRYGAVGNLSRVHHSIPAISKKMCVQYSTLYKFLCKYKQNRGVIVHLTSRRPKGITKLSQRVVKQICSKYFVKQWGHLTLVEWCKLIAKIYKVSISRYTLAKTYKKNNIRWLKPSFKFCIGKRTLAEQAEIQSKFLKDLLSDMRQ